MADGLTTHKRGLNFKDWDTLKKLGLERSAQLVMITTVKYNFFLKKQFDNFLILFFIELLNGNDKWILSMFTR